MRSRFLALVWVDALFHAIAIGSLDSLAIVYAVQRGLADYQVALVGSLPMLIGAAASWLLPSFVKVQHLRRFLLAVILIQITGVVTLFFSTFAENPYLWILLSLSLNWVGGLSASPLWTDFIVGRIEASSTASFLATRNTLVSLVSVCVYLSLTWLLHQASHASLFQFAFSIAICARLVSWWAVYRQTKVVSSSIDLPEIKPAFTDEAPLRVWDLLKMRPVLGLLSFALVFRLIASIAGPFFAPFVMKDLQFSSFDFAILMAMPTVGRFLLMSSWAEAMQKFRPQMGVFIAILGISVSSAFWLITKSFMSLSLIEALCGVFWTGLDLCVIVILQDLARGRARRLVGFYIFLSQLGVLGGALIGKLLLDYGFRLQDLFEVSVSLRLFTFIFGAFVILRFIKMDLKFEHAKGFLRNFFKLQIRTPLRILLKGS